MRTPILTLLTASLVFGAALSADAATATSTESNSNNCRGCVELKAIELQTRQEKSKKKPDFDSLQLAATAIIQTMPDEKKKLTPQQIDRVAAALDASIPNDPAASIVLNNIEIISANREAIDKALKKLPKANYDRITIAIEIALEDSGMSNDK